MATTWQIGIGLHDHWVQVAWEAGCGGVSEWAALVRGASLSSAARPRWITVLISGEVTDEQ